MTDTDTALMSLRQKNNAIASQLAERDELLGDLFANHVKDVASEEVSTAVTLASAGLGGAIKGLLGPNDSIGPVPVLGIVSAAVGITGLFVDEPNAREATHAICRGLGAPVVFDATYKATLRWKHPKLYAIMLEGAAQMAALQARGDTTVTAEKKAA